MDGFQCPEEISLRLIESKYNARSWKQVFQNIDWCIGTASEMLNGSIQSVSPVDGEWTINDYYDHDWSMWATHADFDKTIALKRVRITNMDSNYGFISGVGLKFFADDLYDEVEEMKNDMETEVSCIMDEIDETRLVEMMVHRAKWSGCAITFGRGDTEYYVYMAKKDDKVVAWGLFTDTFLEYAFSNH
jgi:hypothetical protein